MSETELNQQDGFRETYDAITVLEYKENAEKYGETPGERVIMNGAHRNIHKRDDELEDFVKIAGEVAVIDLFKPLKSSEINDWCNSEVGSHVLSHYFDHLEDPAEGGEA